MNQTWWTLIGVLIGALAGIGGSLLTATLQERAEHKRWLREQRSKAYSDALRTLSAATIIPIGTNLKEIGKWYQKLVEVRESLIVLQVYSSQGRTHIARCAGKLISTIDEYNFALVATEATTMKNIEGDLSGFVLYGIGRIRAQIKDVLNEVTILAKGDLEQLIKT